MIILLLAYYLAQSSFGDAGPIPLIEERDIAAGDDQAKRRTLYGITWSCLTTIFLCTWVSIHPNIAFKPENRNAGWFEKWIWDPLHHFIIYKLPLFLCALLVPEYILAWAMRQFLQAGKIKNDVPGWTRTHGFFMIMGGFHLFKLPDGAASFPLSLESSKPSDFVVPSGDHTHVDEIPLYPLRMGTLPVHILKITAPTEIEIRDKGKSDALTKFITLIQTAWFVVQCIARGIQRLPLTELEIVTLAYAMINFFIYVFWWDKPRNVQCPVRLYMTTKPTPEKDEALEEWPDNWAVSLAQRILSYSVGQQDGYVDLAQQTSVPMFWSGRLDDTLLSYASLGPSILGAAFGAIHCIAWWSDFPSHVEMTLWRISCIGMIAVPMSAAILCATINYEDYGLPIWIRVPAVMIMFLAIFVLIVSAWLYIAARIATLVIAFTTLRSLPPSAFIVVDWTGFIPHV